MMNDHSSVSIRQLDGGTHIPLHNAQDRFSVRGWDSGTLDFESNATHFGFVNGDTALETPQGTFGLTAGMYFSLPSAGRLRRTNSPGAGGDEKTSARIQTTSAKYPDADELGSNSQVPPVVLSETKSWGFVVTQFKYRGLFQIGGPIEDVGRLRYIDGCSDTLLIAPTLRGDACLNLLCLPPGTTQSAHTHPSFRVGVVVSGRGTCRYFDGRCETLDEQKLFVLGAECIHSFHTDIEPLTIVAFHPDSDFGPWHDDHPMINRTLIDGVSARSHFKPDAATLNSNQQK